MDFFRNLFESGFMPHGHCYQWLPEIVWLHVVSDGLITLSYASIPVMLAWFVHRRTDLAFKWIFLLFGAFILLCGATHGLEIWTVWHGTYRLTGIVKAATGVVSMSTAGALLFLLPKALKLPSPQQLREANRELKKATEKKLKAEAELAVREREALFKVIVEAAPNGMLLVDSRGNIELANATAEKIFDYDHNQLAGQPLERLIPETLRGRHKDLFNQFFHNSEARTMAPGRELFGIDQSGRHIPIEISLTSMNWNGAEYVLAFVVDISERTRQKELLKEASERFNRAAEGVADGLWEWNIEDNEVWMSDQFFKILGYDPKKEKATYAFWSDRIHPKDKDDVEKTLQAHMDQKEPYVTEHRLLCGDGEYRWFLSRGDSFIESKSGKPFMSGFLTDIHRRKMAEADLAEKTRFLDNIYSGIQHGIFVVDITEENDFRFAAINPAEEELTGLRSEDVCGKRPEDLAPEFLPVEAAMEVRANYQRCLDEAQRVKYTEMLTIKGRETWWITNLTPLFDVEGQIYRIIGSASEITDLKIMERKIREREEYARKILDHSLNGLYIFDLQKNCNTFLNPAYTRITGYTLDDLSRLDLLSLFHPDEVDDILGHMGRVAAVEDYENEELEYRFLHKDGHWIWCLSRDAVFSRDDAGEAREMIGTFIDITDIKNYRHSLEESNHELEQFAFIASHDLREPLRKIKSFGDLLVSRFNEDLPEKGQDYVRRMTGAAERLDLMINDLLAFSRVSQSQESEMIQLDQILENVIEDSRVEIKNSGAMIQKQSLPTVMGDQNHFYQLFLNLIGNALKYRRKDTPPKIEINWVQIGDCARISILDNGIGLPEDKTAEIFHIFKRLHGRGEFSGSGIGLSICKKIVERHGGKIWAENRDDTQGSCFIIELPIISSGGKRES